MSLQSIFTSPREKILWILGAVVLIGIILSLILGAPFLDFFRNQELQARIFLFGMITIGICIFSYGIISKPKIIELVLIIGIITVYILLLLRLGLPERSHLIEYSALSLIILEILLERQKQGKKIQYVNFCALLFTSLIGIIDEVIQIFLSHRVFDINDIIFNCLSAFMAIGTATILRMVKKKIKKKNSTQSSRRP